MKAIIKLYLKAFLLITINYFTLIMLFGSADDFELILWEKLKGKQMLGLRFRAQHPIDIFIADFYCHPIKLAIEVDGGMHKTKGQREYDIGRTAELNYWEIEVIRVTNKEIKEDINKVIKRIDRICKNRQSELS